MRILRKIHTAYGSVVFLVLFLIFFIPFLVPIIFPARHAWVGIINRWWAKLLFIFCLLPYRIICKSPLDPKQAYIFCPNHFSYIDIPTMGLTPINTIFVGKNDMEKVPLFGFMYRKLHITVDRERLKSKYNTFIKSRAAIDQGKSLVIYPEGGIYVTDPPQMEKFKDGAFRLAIEKQIPLVPVTIPHNWIILPPDEFVLHRGKITVIFHEPIETRGMTLENLNELKQRVIHIIDDELKNENRSGAIKKDRTPQPA